jgi:hypothetical protein
MCARLLIINDSNPRPWEVKHEDEPELSQEVDDGEHVELLAHVRLPAGADFMKSLRPYFTHGQNFKGSKINW